jgi:hypothetical protein
MVRLVYVVVLWCLVSVAALAEPAPPLPEGLRQVVPPSTHFTSELPGLKLRCTLLAHRLDGLTRFWEVCYSAGTGQKISITARVEWGDEAVVWRRESYFGK